MKSASDRLEFEQAGIMRDRIYALENVQKSQHVFLSIERDVDAIGLYSDAGETCVRKLELRQGRVVGSSTYFMNGDE